MHIRGGTHAQSLLSAAAVRASQLRQAHIEQRVRELDMQLRLQTAAAGGMCVCVCVCVCVCRESIESAS